MKRIIFITVIIITALFTVAQVFILKVKLYDGKTLEVPTENVEQINFATPVETPLLTLRQKGPNSYVISWQPIDGAVAYEWKLDDEEAKTTIATTVSLDLLVAGTHEFTVLAVTDDERLVNSSEASISIVVSEEDEAFSTRETALAYINDLYSYLPYEAQFQMENKPADNRDADGAAVAMSDESHFSWTLWVPHLNFVTGDYGPATANWNNWPFMYEGIDKTTKAIVNLSRCNELSEVEKKTMMAEARFLRAYCYFQILRRFGPAIVLKDNKLYAEIDKTTIDRNTIDETVDFIISEIDNAILDLPLQMKNIPEYTRTGVFGEITRGAAMAAKSRILLYAASPLFNGCDLYKGRLTNKSGKYLFPQAYDGEKWTKAAEAAKAVIDLNCYALYQDNSETDPMLKAIKSYQGIQFKPWNDEIIWGYWPRLCPYSQSAGVGSIAYMQRARYCPIGIIAQGCSGYCPSLKLVDAYPMSESGRYPIIGYSENGQPIIDELSGYNNEGFSYNWYHPIEGAKLGVVKAHNSCVGRDARYYASVLANGFYWLNDNTKAGAKTIVTFHSNGTSPYKNLSVDCSKVGFLWRRFMPVDLEYEYNEWGTFFWFYYRLAEIYLNYAEACNEKPERDVTEALKYINLIRKRAGLNKLEEAYPEIDFSSNKGALREIIRKERMIEMAFEGHRYYDCRRWMIAEKEFNYLPLTLNLKSDNYESSWERVDNIWYRKMVFEPKHYFMPINQEQLNEFESITQNYGW